MLTLFLRRKYNEKWKNFGFKKKRKKDQVFFKGSLTTTNPYTQQPKYERFTRNMFLCPFSNRSRLPEGDVTKNRTSSSETIKFTLATRAGYPFSNTQTHIQHQQQQQNHQSYNQKPRYPNSSPNPTHTYPSTTSNPPNKQTNNYGYNRDASKLKQLHDPDQSPTITLTTGFRYNSNNNNFDSNSNFNANRTTKPYQDYDTTKTYRQQTNTNKNPSTINTKFSNNEQNHDELEQRQKYLDFIVSDIQPQSFQAPSATRGVNTKPLSSTEKDLVNAFVNSQSSLFIQSTPKSHVITTLPNKPTESQPVSAIHIDSSRSPKNDTYRFVLNTGSSNDKRNTRNQSTESDYEQASDNYQHATHAESENIPLYVRKPQSINSISTSSNSITPLKHEIIVPTTYSPLRNWKIQYLKQPTLPGSEVFNTVINAVAPDDVKKLLLSPQNNRTKSQYETIPSSSSIAIPSYPIAPPKSKTVSQFSYTFDGDKDFERPYKTQNRLPTKFPSIEFRERLNRTFDTTTPRPLVSPFASLQTILEDIKPTQYKPSLGSYSITIGKNNIQSTSTTTKRTTTTTTTTTRAPPPQSSSSSYFKSYYIITAPPKNKTQNPYELTPPSASPPASYTPFSYSPSTTPVSITTNLPSISSTSSPSEWTPIHTASINTNQIHPHDERFRPVNNIQIHPQDERFRPVRPTEHPITFTENPIISITTSFPQKNHGNYIQQTSQQTGIYNSPFNIANENFPPYQTTTPVSITSSTPQVSGFPSHGFPQGPQFPPRDHYRKVVRMRSKKKLTNSAGGLTPVILDPSVQQLSEGDPELDAMRNGNFMKALEAASFNEHKVEHSTPNHRGKSTKPTRPPYHPTRIPNIHYNGNEEETLLRPSKGNDMQFTINDDDALVKYTILSGDGVHPTRFFSNYRQVKDENEQESVGHHSISDYINDGTKYSVVKDEPEEQETTKYSAVRDDEEQESKQHSTLGDFVRDGANFGTEIAENMDEIISQMSDTETAVEPISSSTELQPDQREKFRATVEMPEFNVPTESEIKARIKQLETAAEKDVETEYKYETTTNIARKMSVDLDLTNETQERNQIDYEPPTTTHFRNLTYVPLTMYDPLTSTLRTDDNANIQTSTQTRLTSSTTQKSYSSTNSVNTLPSRPSRVNPAIKSTIAGSTTTTTRRTTPGLRFHHHTTPLMKCIDAKCNEIPSRYISHKQTKSIK